MKMPSFIYREFYVKFEQCFRQKITDLSGEGSRILRKNLWEYPHPQNSKTSFFHSFFQKDLSCEHFKRKFDTIKREKYQTIKPDILITALTKIMDIKFPEEKQKTFKSPEEKAINLYLKFLEKYVPDFLEEEQKRLNSYINKDIIFAHVNMTEYSNVITLDHNKHIIGQRVSDTGFAIANLIQNFYQSVDHRKYEQAWNLLSEEFQNRIWNRNFQRFKEGFAKTIHVRNVHVFDIDETNTVAKVYYEDTVNVHYLDHLPNLQMLPIGRINELVSSLSKLSEDMKSYGLEGVLEKVEINKIFESTFSEYFRFTRNIPVDDINRFLPNHEAISVPRLYTVSCEYLGLSWKINSILPIKNSRHR